MSESNRETLISQIFNSVPYKYYAKIDFVDLYHNPWQDPLNSFSPAQEAFFEPVIACLEKNTSVKLSQQEMMKHQQNTQGCLKIYHSEIKGWSIQAHKELNPDAYIGIFPGDITLHAIEDNQPFLMSAHLEGVIRQKIAEQKEKPEEYPFQWSPAAMLASFSYSMKEEILNACVQYFLHSESAKALETYLNSGALESKIKSIDSISWFDYFAQMKSFETFKADLEIATENTANEILQNAYQDLIQIRNKCGKIIGIAPFNQINELVLINTSASPEKFNLKAEVLFLDGKPVIAYKSTRLIAAGEELIADYGAEYVQQKSMQHFALGVDLRLPVCFK